MTRFGKSRGFTLVEFILALTLGALAMAGVWAVYQERSAIVQAQVAVDSIGKIFDDVDRLGAITNKAQIETTTGTASNLTILLYAQYINAVPTSFSSGWVGADSLPQGVVLTGSFGSYGFMNAWGGTWALSTTNSGTLTQDLTTVTLTRVPTSACTTIISDMAPGIYDTTVNGTLVGLTPAKTTTSAGRNQLRVSQAIPLCARTNSNTLVLRRLKDYRMAQMRWGPVVLDTVAAHEGDQINQNATSWPTTGAGALGAGTAPFITKPGNVTTNFNRIKTAMANREAAQVALP